ncbi:hypothetical protein DNU06_14760 [Putridiphycobacter roseus]|uniref:Twin-arginine translocase TatA/TatE family subunit n=1 Tax=Putridiphycobacter roseus TaxID=2219161 RepID=A0A2W1MVE0_9FLAO|nr:twin-arginine translocase TatA/TatE family subunit [Putridiphycobacter roseus]PZE16059.1 hypothetical protein DNU06_14760 [Putridiphycobacter roseus]
MQVILFLNDFGTGELVFVMFVVLILFGAKNIPSIAKTLGKGMREIRNASDEIKRDITRSATEMKRDLNLNNHFKDIQDPMKGIKDPMKGIEEAIMAEPKTKENNPKIDTE